MGRIFLWVVLALLVLLAIRLINTRNQSPKNKSAVTHNPSNPNEAMSRCAHCGVHLPRSEALLRSGKTWCCDAHADMGANPQFSD